MLRRLFFLFPDEPHAQCVVDELIDFGVRRKRIHAVASETELLTLPRATRRRVGDTVFRIERWLWRANIALFALAVLALVMSLLAGEMLWSFAALAVIIASFIIGEQFVVNVPNVRLTEFTDALSHGEVLLLVDVPRGRASIVEERVHHHHPEAVVCSVSWSTDAFGH